MKIMGDMKSESSDVVFEMVRSVLTEFNDGVVGSDSQLRLLWWDIHIVFLNLMIWEILNNWEDSGVVRMRSEDNLKGS